MNSTHKSEITCELQYLELHLTDHCNLNCKGCGHFSPIAPPFFADILQYQKDIQRLSELFSTIRQIRLMGGEPLLHPDPSSFILTTRKNFHNSDIRFVTNGILLPKASTEFWNACRETETTIDLTLYPPFREHLGKLRVLCASEKVNLEIRECETFHNRRNLKGDSDISKVFKICRNRIFCPFLQKGRIYHCGMSALVQHLNTKYGTQIEVDSGIDIHQDRVTGKDILEYLNTPIETCRWCSYDTVQFPWSIFPNGNPPLEVENYFDKNN